LNEILLIDDDESTNFINKIVLSKTDCAHVITEIQSATQALEILVEKAKQKPCVPELIFLDINMPGMDGWGFLEEYKNLPEAYRKYIKVIMLSTSINPDDALRARTFTEVVDYRSKPLTTDIAKEIMSSYFSTT